MFASFAYYMIIYAALIIIFVLTLRSCPMFDGNVVLMLILTIIGYCFVIQIYQEDPDKPDVAMDAHIWVGKYISGVRIGKLTLVHVRLVLCTDCRK